MIDEKRLEEIREQLRGCACVQVVYDDEAEELIKLARLGFKVQSYCTDIKEVLALCELGKWAQSVGVPMLKSIRDCGHGIDPMGAAIWGCKSALSALPKDAQK